MTEISAERSGGASPGRRMAVLVWAMILALAPCLVGAAVMAVQATSRNFVTPGGWLDLALREPYPTAGAAAVAAIGTYALLVRLVERRWPSELAPASAIAELALGIVLAALAFGLLMGLLTWSGALVWRPLAADYWRWALASGFLSGAVGGLLLGLALQGAVVRLGCRALGPVAGVALAALLAFWLVAPAWPLLPIHRLNAALGGAVLGLLWLRRRRLWLGIGLSTGWGALSGAVIGGHVLVCSSDAMEAFTYAPGRGPLVAWLGGVGGPESSIVLLAGCVLAFAWLAWRAWKEGRFSDT